MTQFLHQNWPEFNELVQKHTRPTCSQNVCISCRKEDSVFILLCTCKHASLFELFDNYKIDYQNVVICLQCHNFLKKVELFKLQVEESLAILNKQTQTLKSSKRLFQDLQCTKTEVFVHNSKQNEQNTYKDEIVKEESSETNSTQDHCNKITTDIKVEHVSYSDLDNDVPLSQSVFVHNSQQNEQNTFKDKIVKDESSETNSTQGHYNKITTDIKVEHESYSDLDNDVPLSQSVFVHNSQQNEQNTFKDEIDKDESSETNSTQGHYNKITTEIEVEHENYPELDNDVPLSQIKKVIESAKKKQKKVKITKEVSIKSQKRITLYKKYEGKFAVIYLSRQEVLLERDRDAAKASYLKLPYKCDSCIIGFDHELTLQDHMEKKHGPNMEGHTCDICKSVLSTEIYYKAHTKSHTRRYECQACGKRCKNVYSMIMHYNEEHGTKSTQYECRDCDFTTEEEKRKELKRKKTNARQRAYYQRQKDLKKNEGIIKTVPKSNAERQRKFRQHNAEKSYMDINKNQRRKHIQSHHKEEYRCATCGKRFVFKGSLYKHEQLHQGAPPRKECPVCQKMIRVDSLKRHSRIHTDRDRYKCAECDKCFVSRASYKNHLKKSLAHASVDMYKHKCSMCDKAFLSPGELRDHVNYTHMDKTQHKCPVCEKALATRKCLVRHVRRLHDGVKEDALDKICQQCGKAFRCTRTLREHEFTHTRESAL